MQVGRITYIMSTNAPEKTSVINRLQKALFTISGRAKRALSGRAGRRNPLRAGRLVGKTTWAPGKMTPRMTPAGADASGNASPDPRTSRHDSPAACCQAGTRGKTPRMLRTMTPLMTARAGKDCQCTCLPAIRLCPCLSRAPKGKADPRGRAIKARFQGKIAHFEALQAPGGAGGEGGAAHVVGRCDCPGRHPRDRGNLVFPKNKIRDREGEG